MNINSDNVNDAFYKVLDLFGDKINYREYESRNGKVLELKEPTTISYKNPQKRVLFDSVRDCNPFFHLAESLWMLAGRADLKSMEHFVPRMRNYSDDGISLWGAYGYRWRWAFGYDQLALIIKMLKRNPADRRCVLQMWSTKKDLNHLKGQGKDVPCNTQIYFKIRDEELSMTVTNRSNDALWGALGANMVHFSILHEYMASMIGCKLGVYYHFTDNLHIYKDYEIWQKRVSKIYNNDLAWKKFTYPCEPVPLVTDVKTFDKELKLVVDDIETGNVDGVIHNTFLKFVAIPVLQSWCEYKKGNIDKALDISETILSKDWKVACLSYLERRHNYE
tara:strand:- start:3636 stop:4637 length:1002 start_codon:yes stop_codon:yes gene_type:complete